ncbi:MAG: hypothetical protein J6J74_08200 [Elusimicrobiaceae bacterium]|nr:hypothetical protein [Elusimicrobiaceae bacterium]
MTQKTNPSAPSVNPADLQGLDGLLEVWRKSLFMALRVALPAVVQSYDRSANRVTVTPAVTSLSGSGQTLTLPQLADIPVCTAGGGGFGASFPLQAGDTGWLLFCDRDISLFKASRVISPANTNRLHNLADAVFYPDVMNKITISEQDAGKAVWQKMDGSIKVALGESAVEVTGDVRISGDLSVSGTVTAADVTAAGDVVAGGISLKSHVHGGVQGGNGTTGAPQ